MRVLHGNTCVYACILRTSITRPIVRAGFLTFVKKQTDKYRLILPSYLARTVLLSKCYVSCVFIVMLVCLDTLDISYLHWYGAYLGKVGS